MKAKSETTLILNEVEKEWLKGLIQNPLVCHKCYPNYNPEKDEPEQDRIIRKLFWDALK